MSHVIAVLSMLHESARRNSASRAFRGQPVLEWTLRRLGHSQGISKRIVLCWDDQLSLVRDITEQHDAAMDPQGARQALLPLDLVTVARRWADGWRGGLLSACEFDRGFHAAFVNAVAQKHSADAIVLVDPAAALVDAALVDAVIAHADADASQDMCFSAAAPGLSAVILRPGLLEKMASRSSYPGRMMYYHPDNPARDPLVGMECEPLPPTLTRTMHRLTCDSDRQIARISHATSSLNGELESASAEQLVGAMDACLAADALPREVVLEVNVARATRAIFAPGSHIKIERPELTVQLAEKIFGEIAAADDIRLTLGGVGDPLQCANLIPIIEAARRRGIAAIHVQTDLTGTTPDAVRKLGATGVDVVSVNLPATSVGTYQAIMGVDGYKSVLENFRYFFESRRGSVPLLVPVFTKCAQNLPEMEAWYDQWVRALGHAVVAGPSDYSGLIPSCAVADMAPPARRRCVRLGSRMTILSDGRVVSCEQDVLGRQTIGSVAQNSIVELWRQVCLTIGASHGAGQWGKHPQCAACREWHRP